MAKVFQDSRKRKGGLRPWIVSYVGLDGRRHRDLANVSTKEEALMVLRAKQTEIAKARITGVNSLEALKPMTFAEFVEGEYLSHAQATHTVRTFEADGKNAKIAIAAIGKMLLRSITSGDVQRFVDRQMSNVTRTGRAIRPATVNRRLAFIKGALSEAARRGYIDRNPGSGVGLLPENNDRIRWLTADEEARVLSLAPDFLRPIIKTATNTGGRMSEVLGLTWGDIDFDRRLVCFAHAKNHRTRFVPMNETLFENLKAVPHAVGPEGLAAFVFTNPATGEKYVDVSHTFLRAARKAGLLGVCFHTTRHTFASRLAQKGVALQTIKELLGHQTMTMTLRYAHLCPSNLKAAVDLLDSGRKPGSNGTSTAQNGGAETRAS
ncbi:MAG: site-specific integrase [Planctomycetota bacterium]